MNNDVEWVSEFEVHGASTNTHVICKWGQERPFPFRLAPETKPPSPTSPRGGSHSTTRLILHIPLLVPPVLLACSSHSL